MNALFLIGEALTDFGGISKKVLAQVNALEHCGINVSLSYLVANDKNKCTGRYVNQEIVDRYSAIPIISEFQWRCKYKNLYNYIRANEIRLVYIRYIHFANPFFISFLRKLKKSGVKILLEIPTYPYDQEYKDLKFTSRIVLLIEKFSRNKFKKYVTRVITLTNDTTIFGVPTIQISNGIDPNSISLVKKDKTNNDIHLIGVASIAYWHGYDRVIEGLHNYYCSDEQGKKKVFFHIAGDNANMESMRYKELVKKYNLNNYVIFYGRKSGSELDSIFDKCDIAVGCLGSHRKGFKYSKSLKNREYSARGLPFFYSDMDEDFEDVDFVLKVPANDDPINIEAIINFVNNNTFDAAKIRNYALENLTWKKQFEKVLTDIFIDLRTTSEPIPEYDPLQDILAP
jgi:glycosyltransferase involved in cell wall biosynthesis